MPDQKTQKMEKITVSPHLSIDSPMALDLVQGPESVEPEGGMVGGGGTAGGGGQAACFGFTLDELVDFRVLTGEP